MSWLIGVIGNSSSEIVSQIKAVIPSSLYHINEDNLKIFAGGNPQTCFSSKDNKQEDSFLFTGVGIRPIDNGYKFLDVQEIAQITDEKEINDLNGHFVLFRWNKDVIKIYTDKLGLRDIYMHKYSGGKIIFSTRTDWIAKIIRAGINYKEFGSRWLLFNQLSAKSIFDGIERITAGTKAIINRADNSIKIEKSCWLPSSDGRVFTFNDYSKRLEELILFPSSCKNKISLSFSGGMDSRVILSYLLKNNNADWYTHTFGSRETPDSGITRKISSGCGFNNEQINTIIQNGSDYLAEIQDYEAQTLVNNGVSGYLQLVNYNKLAVRNEIVIDGGFGEIWRREFFNRLLYKGRHLLISKNIKGIIPHLKIFRADVFNAEINKLMLEGCEEQLDNIFSELPAINKIGVENWIDLFGIKTRLCNYYSYEQARMDSLVKSYMPFIQPVLLSNLFRVSIDLRKNGKLFRGIISENFSRLSKYPLAKGELTHPFRLNTLQARIWSMAHKKLNLGLYYNPAPRDLIISLKPFILDTVSSKDVKENGIYDYKKLSALTDALTKNELTGNVIHQLDWWLAFEMFCKYISMEIKF
jgi:hypothetical protein